MTSDALPAFDRLLYWTRLAEGQPPEAWAAFEASPTAPWIVITEDGPPLDRHRYRCRLEQAEDLPCWAFVLARSYLEEIGEWPLCAPAAEFALAAWEEHQDHERAVREIMATVLPVWPEVTVVYVGDRETEALRAVQ